MVNRERARRIEDQKRKELLLSKYSHNLSVKILTDDGRKELGIQVPDGMTNALQTFSVRSRESFWQETAPTKNFGQQMVEWMGKGKPGIATWVDAQKDPDVLHILQEVSLVGSADSQKADLQGERVSKLLGVINADLSKAGEETLSEGNLTDAQIRSLNFYATYLNPKAENPQKDTAELVETLVKTAALESNGDVAKTIEKLQKVAPLLRVAGDEGQHVLGALTVARVHAMDAMPTLAQVAPDAVLNDDEQEVMKFLRAHREEPVEPMEPGKQYNLKETFTTLTPQPREGHPYWVENISSPASSLSADQIQSLTQTIPLWHGENLVLDKDVFDPIYELRDGQNDRRFANARELVDSRSQLLGVAAASSETPEQQVELFKNLSKITLRAHAENPKLLEEFLKGQNEESLNTLLGEDIQRANRTIEEQSPVAKELRKLYREKYQKEFDVNNLTLEERMFLQGEVKRISQGSTNDEAMVLKDFSKFPDRIFSFSLEQSNEPEYLGQPMITLDLSTTLSGWSERVKMLQETLSKKEPLTLSPEQIDQLDFLSRSINIKNAVQLLKGKEIEPQQGEVVPAPAIPHQEMPIEQSVEEKLPVDVPVVSETQQVEALSALDFFKAHENIPGLPERRFDMIVQNTEEMAPFSATGEKLTSFEILKDGDFNLFRKDTENGQERLVFNTDDIFLGDIFREGKASEKAMIEFRDLGYGQNILLSYILEAGVTPEDQATLLKNVFEQVARLYAENTRRGRNLRIKVNDYFKEANKWKSTVSTEERRERLFGSDEKTATRLLILKTKLTNNEALTQQDMVEMSLYALPFNLQAISKEMRQQYLRNKLS